MKKLFFTILAILYLGASIGATVHLHYCMGKLADWALWDKSSSKCSRCGMEKSQGSDNDCCKDELKHIKIDEDQRLSENFVQLNEAISDIAPVDFSCYPISLPLLSSENSQQLNTPPRSCNSSIHIINCVFRI